MWSVIDWLCISAVIYSEQIAWFMLGLLVGIVITITTRSIHGSTNARTYRAKRTNSYL